jgi:hypothetical protein
MGSETEAGKEKLAQNFYGLVVVVTEYKVLGPGLLVGYTPGQ